MSDETPGTAALRLRDAFPPVPTSDWEAAIRADLKGADYERKLVWRPEPGLAIRPYYRREDLEPLEDQVAAPPGEFPFVRAASGGWESADAWAPPEECIRADEWHDAGATAVQEVAFAIAAGVDRLAALTDEGTPADTAAARVSFAFAVGSAYFLEIAKLRAARMLWAQACAAFGVEGQAAAMRLHVRTARIDKSVLDPYTNLLRATTEALSAVIGGCGRLTVEPFGFDPHLAANVHHVLREEAHVGAVADPAGGAYYVEALTDAVAREAWSAFQQLEADGGFDAARRAGRIDAALASSREAAARAVATRRRTLVGVNNYPNLLEREPPRAARGIGRPGAAPRLAEPFERIRRRTAAHAEATGRVPRVLLLTRGDLKMRIARANFCYNFFGCAGFEIHESSELSTDGVDLIVLCSADAEYLPLAREVCPRVSVPVLVTGNPADDLDALRAAGVRDFVHLGTDAVRSLGEWQQRLGMEEAGA